MAPAHRGAPQADLPRRALVLQTICDVEGGSRSLPEIEFLRGLRRAGLPTPTRQRVVRRRDGRYHLDAEFDPYRVTVEVNGAQHLELLAKEHDDLRRTRLSFGGRLVVDLGSYPRDRRLTPELRALMSNRHTGPRSSAGRKALAVRR